METYGLEQLGIISPSAVYRNLSPAILVEKALARGEGKLNSTAPVRQHREIYRTLSQRQVHRGLRRCP